MLESGAGLAAAHSPRYNEKPGSPMPLCAPGALCRARASRLSQKRPAPESCRIEALCIDNSAMAAPSCAPPGSHRSRSASPQVSMETICGLGRAGSSSARRPGDCPAAQACNIPGETAGRGLCAQSNLRSQDAWGGVRTGHLSGTSSRGCGAPGDRIAVKRASRNRAPVGAARRIDPHWLQMQARAQLMEENYDAAIDVLDRLIASGPVTATLLVDDASAYFERGTATEARTIAPRRLTIFAVPTSWLPTTRWCSSTKLS